MSDYSWVIVYYDFYFLLLISPSLMTTVSWTVVNCCMEPELRVSRKLASSSDSWTLSLVRAASSSVFCWVNASLDILPTMKSLTEVTMWRGAQNTHKHDKPLNDPEPVPKMVWLG